VIDGIYTAGLQLSSAPWWTAAGWPVVWGLIKIVCVIVPLLVAVAYMTLWERKLLGYMQVRQGPIVSDPGACGSRSPMASSS